MKGDDGEEVGDAEEFQVSFEVLPAGRKGELSGLLFEADFPETDGAEPELVLLVLENRGEGGGEAVRLGDGPEKDVSVEEYYFHCPRNSSSSAPVMG